MVRRRMHPAIGVLCTLLMWPMCVGAATSTADKMVAAAKVRAAAEHKNILIKFSSSWCGPCKIYDRFLADNEVKPIMAKHFIIIQMTTRELPNHPPPGNTPGGPALQKALQGSDSIPYTAILNSSGRKITGSQWYDGNIGFPETPKAVERFMRMLTAGAPSISPYEAAILQKWMERNLDPS